MQVYVWCLTLSRRNDSKNAVPKGFPRLQGAHKLTHDIEPKAQRPPLGITIPNAFLKERIYLISNSAMFKRKYNLAI